MPASGRGVGGAGCVEDSAAVTYSTGQWELDSEVFQWRGPAPYFFVATPDDVDAFLHDHLGELTYGWGVIPTRVRIGDTEVKTSLIPHEDVYLVPLKVALRRPEQIDDGDVVRVHLSVGTFSAK